MRAAKQKDHDTLSLICQAGLVWEPDSPYINYLTGVMLTDLGFALGAIIYLEKCLSIGRETAYSDVAIYKSLIGELPAYAIGRNYQHLGDKAAALQAFRLALTFNPDLEAAKNHISELQATRFQAH